MVVVSKNHKRGAYHRKDCVYVAKIKLENKIPIQTATKAQKLGYHECLYCSGFRGVAKSIIAENDRKDIAFFFCNKENVLYIKTPAGFWKIRIQKHTGLYLLDHRNHYDSSLSFEQAMKGRFHCQADVHGTTSVHDLVQYVIKHDQAKLIIADDYKKLPKSTTRQKHYYRVAKNKANRKAQRHLDTLFSRLENSDPAIKKHSVW